MIKMRIIRRFGNLGRINIPKMVRQEAFGTSETDGKLVEISCKDGIIILKPIENNKN